MTASTPAEAATSSEAPISALSPEESQNSTAPRSIKRRRSPPARAASTRAQSSPAVARSSSPPSARIRTPSTSRSVISRRPRESEPKPPSKSGGGAGERPSAATSDAEVVGCSPTLESYPTPGLDMSGRRATSARVPTSSAANASEPTSDCRDDFRVDGLPRLDRRRRRNARARRRAQDPLRPWRIAVTESDAERDDRRPQLGHRAAIARKPANPQRFLGTGPTMREWDPSAGEWVLLVLQDQAVKAQQDHHAEDGSEEPAEIEGVVVADAEQLGEDQEADHGAAQSKQHRRDKSHLVLPGHQQPADVAGDDAQYDRSNHVVPPSPGCFRFILPSRRAAQPFARCCRGGPATVKHYCPPNNDVAPGSRTRRDALCSRLSAGRPRRGRRTRRDALPKSWCASCARASAANGAAPPDR